ASHARRASWIGCRKMYASSGMIAPLGIGPRSSGFQYKLVLLAEQDAQLVVVYPAEPDMLGRGVVPAESGLVQRGQVAQLARGVVIDRAEQIDRQGVMVV